MQVKRKLAGVIGSKKPSRKILVQLKELRRETSATLFALHSMEEARLLKHPEVPFTKHPMNQAEKKLAKKLRNQLGLAIKLHTKLTR